MHKRSGPLSLAVLALLATGTMSGCDSGSSEADSSHPHATVTPSQTPSASGTDRPIQDGSTTITVQLDETAKWRNGVTAKLSGFTRGTSSETASPAEAPYLGFTVTLHNGTKEPLDLSGTQLSCPDHASEIFDVDRHIGGAPSGHALPGEDGTWKVECPFSKSSGKAQIEVTPLDAGSTWYRAAIFTGDVK